MRVTGDPAYACMSNSALDVWLAKLGVPGKRSMRRIAGGRLVGICAKGCLLIHKKDDGKPVMKNGRRVGHTIVRQEAAEANARWK